MDGLPVLNQPIGELISSPPHSINFEKTLDEVVEKLNSFNISSFTGKKR